jgi:hypothetical protein
MGPASYPWKNNSCWLDASLELTFIIVMRHFPAFAACCEVLPAASGLRIAVYVLSTSHLSNARSLDPMIRNAQLLLKISGMKYEPC